MSRGDDLADIHQLINRYSVAMDMRRWELFDDVFLPDAEIIINGSRFWPAWRGVALIREAIELCDYTQHINASTLVEFESEDRATGTTSVHAWHRSASDGKTLENLGRYHDLYVRTPAGWRIARRDERVPITSSGEDTFFAPIGASFARLVAESAAEAQT